MTREERAKQFMPFDAMKGLNEALRDREEKHLRVEKHEVSDEQAEKNSIILGILKKDMIVNVECYIAHHDVLLNGKIEKINKQLKQFVLCDNLIPFSDIYSIEILEL